ncbi:MAG: LPD28 domain-containing protein [Bacillota bacterium]
MSVNAYEEHYEHVELFGKPALFTNSRIERSTVPKGFHCYDLRGSDNDPGNPVTVENLVAVNHAATVLTPEPVAIPQEGYCRLKGKLNFLGECMTLAEFCEEHGLTLEGLSELPDMCFSVLPNDGSLICVKHGETGYYKSDWDTGDPVKNRELADFSNEKLGVSKAQEEAMVIKSMTGWVSQEPSTQEFGMEQKMGGM